MTRGRGCASTSAPRRAAGLELLRATANDLGPDCIVDRFLVHAWDRTTAPEEAVRGLDDRVRDEDPLRRPIMEPALLPAQTVKTPPSAKVLAFDFVVPIERRGSAQDLAPGAAKIALIRCSRHRQRARRREARPMFTRSVRDRGGRSLLRKELAPRPLAHADSFGLRKLAVFATRLKRTSPKQRGLRPDPEKGRRSVKTVNNTL